MQCHESLCIFCCCGLCALQMTNSCFGFNGTQDMRPLVFREAQACHLYDSMFWHLGFRKWDHWYSRKFRLFIVWLIVLALAWFIKLKALTLWFAYQNQAQHTNTHTFCSPTGRPTQAYGVYLWVRKIISFRINLLIWSIKIHFENGNEIERMDLFLDYSKPSLNFITMLDTDVLNGYWLI